MENTIVRRKDCTFESFLFKKFSNEFRIVGLKEDGKFFVVFRFTDFELYVPILTRHVIRPTPIPSELVFSGSKQN